MYKADFKWPNGAYIAVVFNMSWETWAKSLGTSANDQKSSERVPASAQYGRGMRWIYEHAFGETGGMQRYLDVWERHGIRTSCYADGLTCQLYPKLAKEVQDRGHEFLVQGWTHSYLHSMSVAEQEKGIDDTIKVFKRLGLKFTGYSSPGGHLTSESAEIVAKRGFKYMCGFRNAEVPFIFKVGGKKLVGQTSYDVSDFSSYSTGDHSPRQVLEMWKDYFDALYAEGQRGYPKMLAYGTHPILGYGHRSWPLEQVIRYVQSKPKVWFATRGEIAAYMHKNYPNLTLDKFYPEAVNSDRWYGLSIGLGGAEAKREAARYRVAPPKPAKKKK
jgi:allantoinase